MLKNPLTVKQLLEALQLCKEPNSPVKFHDSDSEKTFSIIFVEECVTTLAGNIVLLHRFEPKLANIACEPIKVVSQRTLTFARTEWEECEP